MNLCNLVQIWMREHKYGFSEFKCGFHKVTVRPWRRNALECERALIHPYHLSLKGHSGAGVNHWAWTAQQASSFEEDHSSVSSGCGVHWKTFSFRKKIKKSNAEVLILPYKSYVWSSNIYYLQKYNYFYIWKHSHKQ